MTACARLTRCTNLQIDKFKNYKVDCFIVIIIIIIIIICACCLFFPDISPPSFMDEAAYNSSLFSMHIINSILIVVSCDMTEF